MGDFLLPNDELAVNLEDKYAWDLWVDEKNGWDEIISFREWSL